MSTAASPPGLAAPCRLTASQRADADAVREALDFSLLEAQPAAVAALRRLLDPWLAGDDDTSPGAARQMAADAAGTADAADAADDCPICFTHRHSVTGQLPRIECGTCHNRFHAECTYRWFRARAAEPAHAAGENLCPLCQQPL